MCFAAVMLLTQRIRAGSYWEQADMRVGACLPTVQARFAGEGLKPDQQQGCGVEAVALLL